MVAALATAYPMMAIADPTLVAALPSA